MTRALLVLLASLVPAVTGDAQGFDLDFEAESDAESDAVSDPDSDAVSDSVSDTDSEAVSDAAPEAVVEPPPTPTSEPALDADAPPATPPTRSVRLRSAAGAGFGTLSYERPTSTGVEVLPATPFGALDVLVGVTAWPERAFSLDVLFAYQTSIGLAVELQPLYALPESIAARFHRGEASIAPVFRLGDDARSVAIAVPLGIVAQFFEPSVHPYSLARYGLAGPNARVELRAWLGKLVSVRAGPEIEWIAIINQGLADAGACCQGYAFGGQGAIEAAVGPVFRASLAYRESRGFAPAGAWRFKNIERFLTARIAGEL